MENKSQHNSIILHGVLVQVYGTGVLIVGDAGVGKSECALELTSRGHKFVADDAVAIETSGGGVKGTAPDITKGFLYIRGLGAFRVSEVYGREALLPECAIELVLELSRNSDADHGFEIGPDFHTERILGTDFDKLTLPVRSGRNLAVLIEAAVKIHGLWRSGDDASKELGNNQIDSLR